MPVLASLPVGFEILGPKAAATAAPVVATAVPAPVATAVPAASAPTTIGQAAGSTIAAGGQLKGKCVANQFVDLMVDGKLLATVPCNAAGEWSYTLPLSLGVGEHSFQAISVDKDKKKLSESAVIKITIVAPLPVTGGSDDE